MKRFILEKFLRVTKNREKLEKSLNVKISNRGKEIVMEGPPLDEYVAEKVLDALDFGFPFSVAMSIKEEEYVFEIISIKKYTKKSDLKKVRARIIGSGGKTLRALTELTKCNFEIKGNEIGIIGDAEEIKPAQQALISLIRGSKTANVYAYLEKHHPLPVFDLGLKEARKKK